MEHRQAMLLNPTQDRLTVRDGARILLIPLQLIDWIEVDSARLCIHTAHGRFYTRGTLSEYARSLESSQFVQIHRSTLVNFRAIRELRSVDGGDYTAALRGGQTLRVSRTYAASLMLQIDRNALSLNGHR